MLVNTIIDFRAFALLTGLSAGLADGSGGVSKHNVLRRDIGFVVRLIVLLAPLVLVVLVLLLVVVDFFLFSTDRSGRLRFCAVFAAPVFLVSVLIGVENDSLWMSGNIDGGANSLRRIGFGFSALPSPSPLPLPATVGVFSSDMLISMGSFGVSFSKESLFASLIERFCTVRLIFSTRCRIISMAMLYDGTEICWP